MDYINWKNIVILFLISLNVLQFCYRVYMNNRRFDNILNNLNQMRNDNLIQTNIVLEPLQKTIDKMHVAIENSNTSQLRERLKFENVFSNLLYKTNNISDKTDNLINIFQKPSVAGHFGEMHLKVVVQKSGMSMYCKFQMQNKDCKNGKRPDMTVELPNGGCVFVDSKLPIENYIQALASKDMEKLKKDNIKSIKNHIYSLSKKEYWDSEISPKLVIMFIAIDKIWHDALEEDFSIMEYALARNIVIATPMTLTAFLKTIYIGWEHVNLAKDTEVLKNSVEDYSEIVKDMTLFLEKNSKYHQNQHLICHDMMHKLQLAYDNLMNVLKKS